MPELSENPAARAWYADAARALRRCVPEEQVHALAEAFTLEQAWSYGDDPRRWRRAVFAVAAWRFDIGAIYRECWGPPRRLP